MELGNFSVSLAVADLGRSRRFYETLGFDAMGGDPANGYLIMRNGAATIGLFQGMFEKNILTFNPGWTADAEPLADFQDVRAIAKRLTEAGIAFEETAGLDGQGPAHIVIGDPDGNPVLIDQHVPAPSASSG